MDANKIKQLIEELEGDIATKVNAINALKALLGPTGERGESGQQESPLILPLRALGLGQASYTELAVRALEQKGAPLQTKTILEYIREAKGNPNIERRSVEATLIQHSKKESSRIVKVGPATWALRRYPRVEPAAQSA